MIAVFAFAGRDDAEKFEYMYKKYKKLLLYKAGGILQDQALAEDALSETMIRVYRNMEKIGDPDSPESISFITTIARNVSLTMRKKMATVFESYALETNDNEGPDDELADSFDLEKSVLNGFDEERLCMIIGNLDHDSRNIILMKYAYDFSHREIASQLGITENNVTVRLFRARKKITAIAAKGGLFEE